MRMVVPVLLFSSLIFALNVIPSIPEISVGETAEISFIIKDDFGNPYEGHVNVELEFGTLENPDILIEGIDVEGVLRLSYIAPPDPVDETLKLIFENGEKKVFSFPIFPKPVKDLPYASFTVVEFAGNVAYRETGRSDWKPVKVGLHVFEGFEVGCAQDSYAKLIGPNGAVIEMTPESVIRFEKVRYDGKNMVVSVNVTIGETIFKIIKKLSRMSKFVVKADSVTAGVRGTIFSVENSDEIHVRTFEGEVWVGLPGMFVKVSKGVKFGIGKTALKMMRDFEERSREIWEEFRRKAKEAWKMLEELSPFEGFFEETPFEISPLDRTLDSYEEMFKRLMKMKGGCKKRR